MRKTVSRKQVSSPNRTMVRRTLFLMAVCAYLRFRCLQCGFISCRCAIMPNMRSLP